MKKKDEIAFFWGILFMLIKCILDTTQIVDITDRTTTFIMLTGYICLAVSIIFKRKKLKIIDMLLMCLGIISYMKSGFTGMLTFALIIVAARDIDVDRIIKFSFKINFFILVIHIVLYIIYYVFDFHILKFNTRDGIDIVRHTFLFGHANTFSAYFCWTYMMYLYLKYERIGIIDYMGMILASIFIYVFPNSRTSSIIIIIMMFLIMLTKFMQKKELKITPKLLRQGIMICSIFSVILLIFYGKSDFVSTIDKFFSARIKLARACYEYYGISMFGEYIPIGQELQYMEDFGLNGLTLDSAYYSLMFNYGIGSFLVVIVLLIKTSNKNKIKMKEVVFLDLFAMFALMETISFNPLFGFPLLFINKIFENEENLDEKSINNSTHL